MSGCGAPARPAQRSPSIRGAVVSLGCISRAAAGYGEVGAISLKVEAYWRQAWRMRWLRWDLPGLDPS